MPVQKAPEADLRRRYPLYAEVGLALSLGLTILAFTVPTPPAEPVVVEPPPLETVTVLDIPPTDPQAPPPPPPAPPPPVAVDDAVPVEDIIPDLDVRLDDAVAAPVGPPAPPTIDLQPVAPPAPPTPSIEDRDEGIRDWAEVQPALIGGVEGLQSRVTYPAFARQVGIEGQVVIQFVVDERGNVVDPVVLRSPNDLLSEAALKAVRESRFTPGQQRGRPVKVRFAVPVTFRLR